MAEFHAAIERFYLKNSQFNDLLSKLRQQKANCEKRVRETLAVNGAKESQVLLALEGCDKDMSHFRNYQLKYAESFAERGYEICTKVMTEAKQLPLEEKKKAKTDCISFYLSNILTFQENVLAKLDSLVNKHTMNHL